MRAALYASYGMQSLMRNRLKPAAGNHFGLSQVGWSNDCRVSHTQIALTKVTTFDGR
jgi:hypothetical protein